MTTSNGQEHGTPDERWDIDADFVVLGSGAAGLTGALVAAAGGAHVVLLEKSPLIGGTTAMSGGVPWVPMNHHMAEVGVSDSREEVVEYIRACEGAALDEEWMNAFVDNAAAMIRHVEDLGVGPFRPWPAIGGAQDYRVWLPGGKRGGRGLEPGRFALADLGPWAPKLRIGTVWRIDMLDYYNHQLYHSRPTPESLSGAAKPRAGSGADDGETVEFVGSGTALVGMLFKACLEHGVEPFVETAAESLLVEDGRVVGVRARRDDKPMTVRASRGVLVATGGYSGNEELKRLWLTRPLEFTCEIPENQGDGHLMGLALGAQLAGMGEAWWMPYIHIGVDEDDGVKNLGGTREDRILPHTLIVNRAGKRFINEGTNYYDFGESFGSRTGAGPRNYPAWLIFDQQGVDRYMMLAYKAPPGAPREWITVRDSLTELAEALGIDPDGLTDTVERFNGFARTGTDLDFHRGEGAWDEGWADPSHAPNGCLGTVEKAPFYAVEMVPGALATKGGLRVDGHGRVLSAAAPNEAIPGLYAAGNSSNAAPATSYPGPGSTIGPAMTFGYIIGRQVAAQVAADDASATTVP